MNLLIAEVRAGKREGSVISTQTFDTAAQNDRETWKALRRELEDIGISPTVISEKRQFIITWFQAAVAAGKLEEDVASNDNDDAISLHESESWADSGDHDNYIPTREMSSMMIEPSTANRRVSQTSRPTAPRILGQPADRSSLPPPQKEESSPIRVSYLPRKLAARDLPLLEAARTGDVATMTDLLEKGVSIQTRSLQGRKGTALHLASENGDETAVRFLLSRGAEIESKDQYGSSALRRAAFEGYQDMIRLLLKQGADIESKNSKGDTALIRGAGWGGNRSRDAVRLLLDKGAKINTKNAKGDTALAEAERYQYSAIAEILRNAGAHR